MVKITNFVTLFFFSLIISGCVNSTIMPKPTSQSHTNQATPPKLASLGRLITTPNEEVNEIDESSTTILSRADEDEYREEEIYPLTEEETLITTKEESMEIIPEENSEIVEVIDNTQSAKTPIPHNPYGDAPQNYREKIRDYLTKKANPSYSLKYIFSRPQKAYKNNQTWRGWMVQVDVLKRNGKGEILKNQPYTILFNGSSILEEIKSGNPKSITKVIY